MERESLIGAEGTEPPGAARRTGAAHSRDADESLDAALACTFPASDPVSCVSSERPTNRWKPDADLPA